MTSGMRNCTSRRRAVTFGEAVPEVFENALFKPCGVDAFVRASTQQVVVQIRRQLLMVAHQDDDPRPTERHDQVGELRLAASSTMATSNSNSAMRAPSRPELTPTAVAAITFGSLEQYVGHPARLPDSRSPGFQFVQR